MENIKKGIKEKLLKGKSEDIEPKKKYVFKKNMRTIDYINAQPKKIQEFLKSTIRSIAKQLKEPKLSFNDILMMPYREYLELAEEYTEAFLE